VPFRQYLRNAPPPVCQLSGLFWGWFGLNLTLKVVPPEPVLIFMAAPCLAVML
jgi:hypothetical protein